MANPNPSPETRFQPGQSGNPGGKTSEHREAEIKAAEIAAQLRLAMLSRMQELLAEGSDAVELMTGDALRLFKDSEDRAHGAPKQVNEIAGKDGGPITFADVTEIDDATLAAIAAGRSA